MTKAFLIALYISGANIHTAEFDSAKACVTAAAAYDLKYDRSLVMCLDAGDGQVFYLRTKR